MLMRPLALGACVLFCPSLLNGQTAAARVDSVFQRWNSKDSPGCAVAVGQGGRAILERAYGMADLEHDVPNTPATIFEGGSVSKQFTAAAIVLLALDGKLSLDDDVRKYIPEVPDYSQTIRLQHLLNHTSGLRDWGSVMGIAGWPRTTRVYTHAHVLDIVSRQRALNFPPGREYSYSNTGYNLLAIVVQRVSGMSLPEFTRRRLFEPLGMTHTSWRDDFTRIVKGRAIAYEPRGQNAFAQDMPFENVYGNSSLLTTVGDLLIWNENLHTGKLGGAAFLEMMHKQGVLNSGRKIAYASGLTIGEFNGTPTVNHTGSTAGYRAFLARYPDKHMSVALLCNVGNANPGALGNQVASVFIPPVPMKAAAPQRASVPAEQMSARAGLYRDVQTGEPLRLTFSDGALRLGTVELVPVSATTFAAGNRRFVFQSGSRPRLISVTAAADTAIFEPVAAFSSTPAQLTELAGDYYSPDTETTMTVVVEDGRVIIKRRPDTRIPLTPLYADVFQSQLGLIRFVRDGSGRVTELSVGQDRVYDLRFSRR
jgi:CubicO group peptidase (beta-lactamase class C family)